MQRFKVAHIHEQGEDLVIVFVADQLEFFSADQKNQILGAVQLCSRSAGLRGTVALLWSRGVWCEKRLHRFFSSVPFEILYSNINKELTCNNL